MQQLEIEYFFPLTEQIPLDLDYEPSAIYAKELNRQRCAEQLALASSGQYLVAGGGVGASWTTPTYQFRPNVDCVGHWAIGDDNGIQVWRPKRPNWLHQTMTKFFFGWKWKDK
jgi:hypothetical protein